uniref:Uncharacterized protein n=1 Tax=viral metagenome TaxID=1070528 RepID=A0A6M3JAK0_9ZZZZ
MADLYWVAGTGNWTTAASWSDVSGGSGTASAAPVETTNVHFDVNSFPAGGTATVNATAECLDMDWTGATNTPTLTVSSAVSVYGSVTFIAAMVMTGAQNVSFWGTGKTITTNGLTITVGLIIRDGASITLSDNYTTTGAGGDILTYGATLNTNGKTVSCNQFYGNATAKTVTLGASSITCKSWDFSAGGLTLTANNATINVTGTGTFAGGAVTTYNNINLNGTAHTLSGDWTCNLLRLKPATVQTITGTAGQVITVRCLDIPSHGKNVITLTGAGAWTIQGNRGYFEGDYLNLTNVVVGWKYLYYAGDHSTDGGGNTNWIFRRVIRPSIRPRIGVR